MNKKQKLRVVVIFPVIAVMLVFGGMVYGVLQSAASPSEPSFPATMAQAGAVEGYAGEDGYDPSQAVEMPAPAPAPSCAFDFLLGQTFEQAEAQVRSMNRPYRILRPGDAVTDDYSADRINLNVDETGIVVSVNCG